MTSSGSSSSRAAPDAAAAAATVVVGVLTYQDAVTVADVAAAAREGLTAHFGGGSTRIVITDCGSTDSTMARARTALAGDPAVTELTPARSTADLLELPYHGIPGKARALHATLAKARELDARACVIVDGGVRTMTPQWIEWLARPIVDHAFDFVSPAYHRHAFEGALTKGLVYPLVRAVHGVRLRQPAAAEFACSRRLIDHVLEDDIWDRDGAQIGIDLWLTTSAAGGDFRFGEAALGTRSHHARGQDALDLGATIVQIVGSLFTDLERRASHWQRTRGSVPVQRFGALQPAEPRDPPAMDVNRLIETFRLGDRELRDVWTWVLPPRTIVDLRRLAGAPAATFRLDDELWARIVYDFAIGHRLRVLPREHVLRSLVPLYAGWLASFILQVRESGSEDVDERVEALAAAFETHKPYLISRWRWPERFRT